MGGGFFLGVIWGSLVALVVAVAVSLSTPLPDRGPRMASGPAPIAGDATPRALGTGAATQDAAPAPADDPADAPAQTPEVAPEVAPAEVTGTAEDPAGQTGTPTPQPPVEAVPEASGGPVTAIPLPSGSEFNRPPPEQDAALPGTDAAPQASAPVTLAVPDGTVPQALDTAPAPQPDIAIVPTAPVPGALAALELGAPSVGGREPGNGAPRPGPAPLGAQGPEVAPRPETGIAPLPQITSPEPSAPDGVTEEQEELGAAQDPVAEPPRPMPVQTVLDEDAPLPPVRRLQPPEGSAPLGLVTEDDLTTPAGTPPAAPQTQIAGAAPVGQPRSLSPGEPIALPQIQQPAQGVEAEGDDATAPPETVAEAAGDGALAAYSVPFTGDGARPLIAVVLIDDPDAGLEISTLTRFSFPVAFAIDPLRPDAAMRAAAYREAGFEVLMLGTVLPDGATAQDVEVALTAAGRVVPEAIALLDTPDSRIQSDRPVLDAAVAYIEAQGQGMLAFPRGLNAAEQTALRADVPAATLFRLLDDEGQRATVITRFLGRAEFAAQQEGAIIVAGHTRPDTVTALFSWALSGRDEGVAIAPVSEVLRRSLRQ